MILSATGHRPNKLGGYSEEVSDRLRYLAVDFLQMCPDIITNTISGMALGWDMAWAEASVELRIPFVAAVPFEGQESKWPCESQKRYHDLLDQAQEVVIIGEEGYSARAMQERNEWMVDHCDKLIALWDGTSGGTANCVRYARRFNKPIVNIWDIWNATH